MPISLDKDKEDSNISKGLKESQQAFEGIKIYSKAIQQSIEDISNISKNALDNFETLKYRKQNIEQVLSAMTTFTELRRILPLLQGCVEQKNIEDATNYMKKYK